MMTASFSFLEFFAGGGMAREGLGPSWQCLFANDIAQTKGAAYAMNFGHAHLRVCDIAALTIADIPTVTADLAWASFPCQDLSLAGDGKGLGGARSGTVWQFFRLMRGLRDALRAPRIIVLENVVGWLTSQNGKDFAAVVEALSEMGYRSGAVVIDAAHFVPQSRERVFLIGVRNDITIPPGLIADEPQADWHPASMVRAVDGVVTPGWMWWRLPKPAMRNTVFADLIEQNPNGVGWHTTSETAHILRRPPKTGESGPGLWEHRLIRGFLSGEPASMSF